MGYKKAPKKERMDVVVDSDNEIEDRHRNGELRYSYILYLSLGLTRYFVNSLPSLNFLISASNFVFPPILYHQAEQGSPNHVL